MESISEAVVLFWTTAVKPLDVDYVDHLLKKEPFYPRRVQSARINCHCAGAEGGLPERICVVPGRGILFRGSMICCTGRKIDILRGSALEISDA